MCAMYSTGRRHFTETKFKYITNYIIIGRQIFYSTNSTTPASVYSYTPAHGRMAVRIRLCAYSKGEMQEHFGTFSLLPVGKQKRAY